MLVLRNKWVLIGFVPFFISDYLSLNLVLIIDLIILIPIFRI
jgi:hypothetical protein